MQRVGVIGAGAWGTAPARDPALASEINARHENRAYLPETPLVRLPTTKPAWTLLVNSDWVKPPRPYSATSEGTNAEAENHNAMTATWQKQSTASEAHLEW